jgi:uncharacterized protein (DUF2126 family)
MIDDLDTSLAMHDDLIARRGVDIWVGAAPTFTRADSVDPAWLADALGDDKLARAEAIATRFADLYPGASMARVADRIVSGDARFAFGVQWNHDGTGAATGERGLAVTAEPGVIAIHMAPCETTTELVAQARRVWVAAANAGLSPSRRRHNGDIADSGGGAVLALGGSTPATSPFLRYPHVLPALVRYLDNHPSLSYWFANEWLGSASPAPRPDEGRRERFDELDVTLGWLEAEADRGELSPDKMRQALAPLLVDVTGNAHRAEIGVDRLLAGIVELRAFRMPERPTMLAAATALMRSIVARLAVSDYREPVIDWHDELHDRFALPIMLSRDLRRVLGDLDEHGLGVPALLRRELDAWRAPGIICNLGDATLELRPALEFWPILGDGRADTSTQRLELSIEGPGPDRVAIDGRWATLRAVGDGIRAIGVRRRAFRPEAGFHLGLAVTDPLVIEWSWQTRAQRIELWARRPSGGAYTELPAGDHEALDRRAERISIATHLGDIVAFGHWPETRPYTIDLRLARG